MAHEAVAIGGWNYENAFFLYFVAVAVPLGDHMTSADVPRPLGLRVA